AILLAALLLAPVRAWWVLLVAAFPAHLLAEIQGGVPLSMVLCWFVSNASEALIGAASLRFLLVRPLAFDSIHSAGLCMFCGVFLAPLLSSLLDAGFVSLIGWGETDYWKLWRTRFFSNILATLTIVPLIITWARSGPARVQAMAPRELIEGVCLLFGLLTVG